MNCEWMEEVFYKQICVPLLFVYGNYVYSQHFIIMWYKKVR